MQLAETDARPRKPAFQLTSAETILGDIRRLVAGQDPKSAATRSIVLQHVRSVLADARTGAEAELMATGKGTRCAMNLSAAEDEIIRAVHHFAVRDVYPVDNPSGAEMISIAAVGGYGRGTLAPGSDIDLLFILPYKQTPWGEQITEYILYMLWDLGQKVGHAVRSVDDCIRMARSDMTVRTARDLYTRRNEGVSLWVVPADAITTSDPDAKGAYFESPAGKNYRHATYYTASEGVPHL